MTVTIVTFASLAEQLGFRRRAVELSDNATVQEAVDELTALYPTLSQTRDQVATAVNQTYVGPQHRLNDGDELALIPPVSGG